MVGRRWDSVAGFKIKDAGYRIQDTGFRIRDAGSRYKIQDTELAS
jgi:hypothetical protein